MITFEDFKKLDIRIGKIVAAEKVENADKLLKLTIDFETEKRTIISGIAEFYSPEQLVGKLIPILTNLKPRTFRGIESQGMILAVDVDGKPILLLSEQEIPPGSVVK